MSNFIQDKSLSKDIYRATFWGAVGGVIQSYDYLESGSPATLRRAKKEIMAKQQPGRTVWSKVLPINRNRSGEFFGDLVSGALSLMFPSNP